MLVKKCIVCFLKIEESSWYENQSNPRSTKVKGEPKIKPLTTASVQFVFTVYLQYGNAGLPSFSLRMKFEAPYTADVMLNVMTASIKRCHIEQWFIYLAYLLSAAKAMSQWHCLKENTGQVFKIIVKPICVALLNNEFKDAVQCRYTISHITLKLITEYLIS